MNWYNERYSAYFAAPDKAYPLGSAVDSTSEDNLDGTPYLAAFFNDVIGSMQAIIFGVFGTDYEVSGEPDSCVKSDVWDAIKKFVNDGDKTLQDAVDAINAKIPAQASAANQLADKEFVNSSIATNTAYFVGTFESVAALNASSGTKTNNDYAFVKSTDSAGNTIFSRYKWNGTAWLYEYELNNSSFTASQWAAVNSGATAAKISLIKTMTGATATTAGTGGFVPQAEAGKQNSYLRGDGTWQSLDAYTFSLQTAFDVAHPVNDVYIQFPQRPDPHTLYNKNGIQSTWEVINYNGAFFRAAGGNAESFKTETDVLTLQDSQNKSHSHKGKTDDMDKNSTCEFYGNAGMSQTPTGFMKFTGRSSETAGTTGGSFRVNLKCDISHTHSFETDKEGGGECRPVNYTIRIWIRSA